MASLFEEIAACHRRLDDVADFNRELSSFFGDLDMLKLIMFDPRIKAARQTVAAKYGTAAPPMLPLNILRIVITDFEELAPLLDDPTALVAEILSLLAGTTTPPPPAPTVPPTA